MQIAELRRLLDALRPNSAVSSVQSEALTKRLLAAVAAAGHPTEQPPADIEQQPQSQQQGHDGTVTYELFYGSGVAARSQAFQAAEIESKLAEIERHIGSSPDDTATIAARLGKLEQKLQILEPGMLDSLSARVSQLTQHMATAARKPEVITAQTRSKVDELLSLMEQWGTFAGQLPALIERLRSLKSLHEDAAQFSNTLHGLSETQQGITAKHQQYEKILSTVCFHIGYCTINPLL